VLFTHKKKKKKKKKEQNTQKKKQKQGELGVNDVTVNSQGTRREEERRGACFSSTTTKCNVAGGGSGGGNKHDIGATAGGEVRLNGNWDSTQQACQKKREGNRAGGSETDAAAKADRKREKRYGAGRQ